MSSFHEAQRRRLTRTPRGSARRTGRALFALTAAATTALGGAAVVPASAATGTATASFSGGTGTVTSGGILFAKAGAALTLTVVAPSDTTCMTVPAGFTGATTSPSGKSSWTFTGTASGGDGARAFTVVASPKFNTNGCTGASTSAEATYWSDNTGPAVSPTLAPAANASGWNNSNTTLTWSAADAGAGVASGPSPASSTESSNGIVTRTSTATDRLGNTGTGTVVVRIDKANPSISGASVRNPDGSVTVTFTCSDSSSGQQQASGVATCLAAGSSTNQVTVRASGNVTGTATDKAGNTASTTIAVQAGDTSPPQLSGSPTTQPNTSGWYRDDVTIHWTASDAESGIPTQPADTTISGEGSNLASSVTVKNGAGLGTTATSAPPVNIDRTAPTTAITGGSNTWTNGNVTLKLTPADAGSGVASTQYAVDGGPLQDGTSISLATEGEHTVTYRSTDRAGNTEALQTAVVRIDRTAPTITHTVAPPSYTAGTWTNQDVTVTFVCGDQGGSGVADCTAPVSKSAEGEYTIAGTARDNAGNSASDSTTVRIDKTRPTLTADVAGTKNAAGWYRDDVTVTYTATDALSGVTGGPEPTVLREGAQQTASASATDAAGNTSSVSVSGIDIDTTAPTLTADVPSGWHTDDVTVSWSCTDGLSGVADAPADSRVSGEGDNLSATASCTDVAGNSVVRTVGGIKIDRTAPVTTADVAGANEAGWYGDDVQVTLHGSDNLRGAVTTYYRIDGDDTKTYGGPFSVGEGEHTVSFWSVDAAGNTEVAGTPLELKVDKTAPETTVVNPISPESGWFVVSGIPVAFKATDNGSGVAATYYQVDGGPVLTYGDPFIQNLSTGEHTITYWSADLAGNTEARATTNTIAVNVDTDAPTITGKATPAPNAAGWNNTPVDVKFTCADVGSGLQTGVAGCAGDTTLPNDGVNQSVTGDAVDVAGNSSSATVSGIDIDTVRPTLTGVLPAASGSRNDVDWYRDDVSVTWVGDDGLSRIDPETQPAPSRVTGEGTGLSTDPVTIADKAGNVSVPVAVGGINIDRTAPVVTGGPTMQPNAAGWYRDQVVVDFTCTDNLSGVASCPTSKTVRGDGAGQSVTSDRPRDVAGNIGAARTVDGINVDGSAPTSTADNTCTAVNEWCTGDTADVVISATDQAGLSGVRELRYSVDGGAEQTVPGSSTTVSVPLTGTGAGSVKYHAVDNAGNVEPVNTVALKWDNIAPTVSHSLSPVPNADDWNNSNVTVTFAATDDDKGSGIAGVTQPVTVSTETAGQEVVGTAKDTAGNVGTDKVTVKLDKTRPTISGAVTGGTLGSEGWYRTAPTVTFTCSDTLSGIAATACPSPVTVTTNGTTGGASGTVADRAGNTATASITGLKVDTDAPTLTTADVNVQGATYTLGGVPAATCTAKDTVSGLASCTVKVSGGNTNGTGTFAYTATATDKAGNSSTVTGSYQVVYRFGGFLQPINDTAHDQGSTSTFKAGSTVPVKFQLLRVDGTPVQPVAAPTWLTPVKGGATTAPVDETVYTASADSGSTYRYDASANQYIYNWKTGTGGNYWRIGVKLDDGQTYFVNIGLR
ncbi:OmpL47-type beta-barrel domain-containing protein [Nocardioides sp. HB32]